MKWKLLLSLSVFFLSVVLSPSRVYAQTATPTPAQMCGGIAGIACPAGQTCYTTATYPDASGICITSTPSPKATCAPTYCAAPRVGCTYVKVSGQCGCGTLRCSTPLPSIRPSVSPSPRPPATCNNTCGLSGQTCGPGLICYQPSPPPCPSGHYCAAYLPPRVCRNPSCLTSLSCGCSTTPSPSVPPVTAPVGSQLPGDVNNDGKVDIFDYNIVLASYGSSGSLPADLNHDNIVNIFDYNIVVAKFGTHR